MAVNDHDEKSITDITQLIDYLYPQRKADALHVGTTTILSLWPGACAFVKKNLSVEGVKVLGSDVVFSKEGDWQLVTGFGFGAPALALKMEEWRAFGSSQFLIHGTVGAVDLSLQVGEIVEITKAISGEGTSQRYVGLDKEHLKSSAFREFTWKKVCAWSTDAPMRETASLVDFAQKQGAQVIDMEAAAAFAVGTHYDLKVQAMAVISDRIITDKWDLQLKSAKVVKSLQDSLLASIET